MKSLVKILLVLISLGFIGNLLNEKINYILLFAIVALGVITLIMEIKKPLELRRKHKEAMILFILKHSRDESIDFKQIKNIIKDFNAEINYKISVGYSLEDFAFTLEENKQFLTNELMEFDEYQKHFFVEAIQRLIAKDKYHNTFSKSKINEHLAKFNLNLSDNE